MDEGTYVVFLILGIALVVADGQIIYRSGLKYLSDSYGEEQSAKSMARLVAVLFNLAVVGVLLLISVISVGDTPMESVVLRLGVVLLLLAVAHGLTIKVLTRMRDRLDAENLTKQRTLHAQERAETATPPSGVGAVDAEAVSRAPGDAEARLSRAPGAEPGARSTSPAAGMPAQQQRRGAVSPEIR